MATVNTQWNDIELLIVGSGTMGASLAQTYAQSGFTVGMLDISEEILERGFRTIEQELEQAKGRIFSQAEAESIRGRILGTTSYETACSSPKLRLVIEAATERIDVKKKIFSCLDSLLAPGVVLASNSSSLDTNILAGVTKRPESVVWMHYFYLPHKNRAGEYAGTDTASDQSRETARSYLKLGGKIPTLIRGSRKGGVADVLFVSLLLEATRMLEEGFDIPTIETAGRKALGIPIGFLELMDVTGLPVGLHSMHSFSDSSNAADPLFRRYGNFFTPRQNYIDLVQRYDEATDKSAVRWVEPVSPKERATDSGSVDALAGRFLAISFLTAAETVDAGLITIEDLELLTQNAFLWSEGPFTIMKRMGSKKVRSLIARRAELARSFGQDFPVADLLKKETGDELPFRFRLSPVSSERERGGAVRRITLSNPRSANAMNNEVFRELRRQFTEANEDDACKVIIFDTAPIKTFIAGADIPSFVKRIKNVDFDAIRSDTAEWQDVIYHVMTGTEKPKIAIVDGQAFGGGVEVACAFATDPCSIVLLTNRTSFSLPETRLGIYPGLRGTLCLPQMIYRATGDAETAVVLARYYGLAAGTVTSSPRIVYHLGCGTAIVPQQRRDDAAGIIAEALIRKNGSMLTTAELNTLPFERLPTTLSFAEREELNVVSDLFGQDDLLPTLYAQARGQAVLAFTGEMKLIAERAVRKVVNSSPNAVSAANYLLSRGFEKFLQGEENDLLAEFELEHHLRQVFEHPDALIGLEAVLRAEFPTFRRRYPL